ncbi:MAG: hypothetical protein LUC85_03670 [Bacteroidales bacterium]|nr:hypothetical protein [Bacteroidales bacterium]MCD8393918.1 hypothetical protein [Bacteroidales bacterium]
MRKLLLMLLVAAMPVSVSSQGFLKKLGKAASKLDQSLSTSKTAGEDNLVAMPGVNLQVTDVYHDGLGAMVDFTISNTSQNVYDITFNGTDGLDAWSRSQAVGGDGNARGCYVRSIGDKSSMDMITRYRLLPGASAKGHFKINNLDRSVTSLNNFSIAGLWQANEDNNNHNFRFNFNGPVTIVTPMNTTQDGVYSTMPNMAVEVTEVKRDGANVMVYMNLKNINNLNPIVVTPSKGYVKDASGNDNYRFAMAVNGKGVTTYDKVTFAPDVTVPCIFAIYNVPTTVTELDDLLWMLDGREYFIEIRRLLVPTK